MKITYTPPPGEADVCIMNNVQFVAGEAVNVADEVLIAKCRKMAAYFVVGMSAPTAAPAPHPATVAITMPAPTAPPPGDYAARSTRAKPPKARQGGDYK
jgi:hypothetical protein